MDRMREKSKIVSESFVSDSVIDEPLLSDLSVALYVQLCIWQMLKKQNNLQNTAEVRIPKPLSWKGIIITHGAHWEMIYTAVIKKNVPSSKQLHRQHLWRTVD